MNALPRLKTSVPSILLSLFAAVSSGCWKTTKLSEMDRRAMSDLSHVTLRMWQESPVGTKGELVWFASVEDQWIEGQGIVQAARVEVRCGKESRTFLLRKNIPTESACGLRLRLVKMEPENPEKNPDQAPRVELEIMRP